MRRTIGLLVLDFLASGAWLASGCGEDGAVRLRVELPSDPALSPVGPSTPAQLTLWAESAEGPPEVLTRDFDPGAPSAELGELAIRDGVRLTLEVESPGGRLLGFGRAADPISVTAGDVQTVPILLRRPFAYVAGASRMLAMDTTLEPGQDYEGALAEPPYPLAVVTTSDGAEILVLAGGRLSLLSTSDHRPMGADVSIGNDVRDLAVSPDSRWAVARRDGGVSIVDLDDLRAGGGAPREVPLGGAWAVAVDATTAYVLVDGGPMCGGSLSSIVPVDLLAAEAGGALALGAFAADLAVDPESGTLVAAETCAGKIVMLTSLDDASPVDLLSVPQPTTVAVSRRRVWAAGTASGGSSLVLASIGLDREGMTSVTLPAAEASARTTDFSEPGQSAEVRMTADSIRAIDMAVLPDGEQVALISYAQFHSDEIDGFIGFAPVIVFPTIDVTHNEYMLIDARNGGVIQRLRTMCTLATSASDWGPELIDPASWQCTDSPGQDVSAESFSPSHIAVLYGDR